MCMLFSIINTLAYSSAGEIYEDTLYQIVSKTLSILFESSFKSTMVGGHGPKLLRIAVEVHLMARLVGAIVNTSITCV